MSGCAVMIGLLAAVSTAGQPLERPNILLLLADDMRADSIAALGNPHIRTPALDALVARGTAFTKAYCLGGNQPAVCTPSRNMLLSGKSYFRWREFLPPGRPPSQRGMLAPGDGPSLPRTLRQAGYLTYHHGKRGNTAPLIEATFEINRYLDDDEQDRRSGEPGCEIVDRAIDFLQHRRDPRPWFLYLAFANPHDPRIAAEQYRSLYQPESLPLPGNFLPVHPFDNGELVVRDEQLLPWPRTTLAVRRTLHEYYATITGLDHHIGRLLEALRSLGQLDRTLVIFAADQGIAVGSHGLLGKQSLYDHSMKVPLIFSGPGIPRARRDALVYLHDLYPTLADLVGAPVPPGLDGRSFRAVLEGGATTARPELMLAYRQTQRAIRNDRWKLIRYPQIDRTQLFDLRSDPDELCDLAGLPDQQERVADLLSRLSRLQASLGDNQPRLVAKPVADEPVTPERLRRLVPAGEQGQKPDPR